MSADRNPAIPPFWQRLNKFFLYPLQTEALMYGIGLAACSLLVFIPVVGVVVLLIVILAVARYAFKIAALSSFGIFRLDDYTPMDEEDDWKTLPWKFVGAVFVQLIALGYIIETIPEIAPIGFLVFSLLIPATMMVLIQHHSLGMAINPLELWRCISGIGWPYLILIAFTFLLIQGSAVAAGLLGEIIPEWLSLPGVLLVFIYFSWVNAALIGYTMYQYHRTLDIDVVKEYEEEAGPAASPREEARRRDAAVSQMVQQGQMADALAQAKEWLRETPESLPEHRRYHRLLRLDNDPPELMRHGQQYIELLLKKRAAPEALQVYKAISAKHGQFVPASAVMTYALAQNASKGQDHATALQLLRGFDKRFAGHALIPAAFALIVRVLHTGLHRQDQALAVYQGLQSRYPNDPHTQEAGRLMQASAFGRG
ncbi:MAG: hypothetical protein Q4G39_00795 [Brachymonas sp.]|nr:hypothetical protein [Brachymonas sp.]